ncbi:MAG: hypothetical protein K9L30_14140 [Desulfobacterales bacterium]|nr:hypothetical protein [Desulfobacterales bacterium]
MLIGLYFEKVYQLVVFGGAIMLPTLAEVFEACSGKNRMDLVHLLHS